MAIIKWEPFGGLGDFDRFFDDFQTVAFPKMGWDLAVDVYEDKENVMADMNLPGIDPEKVEVSVEDDTLRISGKREEEKEEKNKQYYSKEIRRGSFERAVRLPVSVQLDKVRAEYTNGVLHVVMPKAESTKPAKVKIEVKK